MNKVKNERYYKELEKRDEGAVAIRKMTGYKCGNCDNDLIQPYTFCRFCGYRVKEG